MLVSQKTQYALRALFELAKNYGEGPVKIASVAEAQAIPVRFLEVILSQLKQGGFVRSVRGNSGGYVLDQDPAGLTVGEIIRFVQGPMAPVECISDGPAESHKCPLYSDCVFLYMWRRVADSVAEVYDSKTLQDLVAEQVTKSSGHAPNYQI